MPPGLPGPSPGHFPAVQGGPGGDSGRKVKPSGWRGRRRERVGGVAWVLDSMVFMEIINLTEFLEESGMEAR